MPDSEEVRSLVSSEIDLRSLLGRQQPLRWSSRYHAPAPCVDDTIIRVWIDDWSDLFLESWQTRHPLSRSRAITRAHVQERSDKH